MAKKPLREFFDTHIDGTAEKALVAEAVLRFVNLTNAVSSVLGLEEGTYAVHITTRALKHLYDKKPAEEFFSIIDGLDEVARFPGRIYKNKHSKRGGYCLVGAYCGADYICVVEIVEIEDGGIIQKEVHIATAFRKRDEKYLAKYTLLWSREDGNPHRNALDAP